MIVTLRLIEHKIMGEKKHREALRCFFCVLATAANKAFAGNSETITGFCYFHIAKLIIGFFVYYKVNIVRIIKIICVFKLIQSYPKTGATSAHAC